MQYAIRGLILLGLTAAFTNGASAASCAACDKADQLTKELKALNYSKAEDRLTGQDKAGAGTLQLSEFAKLSVRNVDRLKIFKSLLTMAREAGPYDGESSLADQLASLTNKDAALKTAYLDYLKTAPKAPHAELCKSRRLETSVDQDRCIQGLGKSPSDAKMKACFKPFNYETCLSGK